MIKAIIFDYFGVISSDEYWRKIKQTKTLREEFSGLKHSLNIGEINWLSFLKTVSRKTGIPLAELEKNYAEQRINPELTTYISSLRPKYKIALLSNVHHDFLEPILEKTGLKEVFDVITISSRLRAAKPNPETFQDVLDRLQVGPKEAILVDDKLINVDAAQTFGLQAVLYQDFEQMKVDLEKILARER